MFEPPRCPNSDCSHHTHPTRRFWTRHGSYRAKCRRHPVPRFLCRSCGHTFSRQTFQPNFRDHRPGSNRHLFALVASGVSIRKSARKVGLSLRCAELKLRKMARHGMDARAVAG